MLGRKIARAKMRLPFNLRRHIPVLEPAARRGPLRRVRPLVERWRLVQHPGRAAAEISLHEFPWRHFGQWAVAGELPPRRASRGWVPGRRPAEGVVLV